MILKQLTRIIVIGLIFIGQGVTAAEEATKGTKGTVLITGANRGIGLALAEKFHRQGFIVIATARKPQGASALKNLGVQIEQLDISNQASVDRLKQRLAGIKIDILINNAGIMGHISKDFANLKVDQLSQIFEVNSLGALRVIQALIPNLQKSGLKIIANISSKMGSIKLNTHGCCLGYRASKAALNSFNKTLSLEYDQQGFIFVVLHPGWVRTDMTSDQATYSPKESAGELFKVITKLGRKDNGKFYDLHAKALDW